MFPVEINSHFLTIGFPIHLANRARSTPHGNAHRISTVSSREVIEPILKTRKIGLQHMLKTKKLKILTEDQPPPLSLAHFLITPLRKKTGPVTHHTTKRAHYAYRNQARMLSVPFRGGYPFVPNLTQYPQGTETTFFQIILREI